MERGAVIAICVVAVLLVAVLLFLLALWMAKCYGERPKETTTTEDGESKRIPLNEIRLIRKGKEVEPVPASQADSQAGSKEQRLKEKEASSGPVVIVKAPAKKVDSDGQSYFQSLQRQLKGVKSVSDYQKK